MKLPLYQIDAFAGRVFAGNPAAVCPLDAWLPVETMQAIAAENNLSETAFFVTPGQSPQDASQYDLRWFTPTTEVDLCGHATLASAHVLWNELGATAETLRFNTKSGIVEAGRKGDLISIALPRRDPTPVKDPPPGLADGLGRLPDGVWAHGQPTRSSYLTLFADESDIAGLAPDFRKLSTLTGSVVIATAPGAECAFVSRFFAPCYGIDEDPVTGSAHCILGPFWQKRLGTSTMSARQVSARGGELMVDVLEDRVVVAGRAVKFMKGTLTI